MVSDTEDGCAPGTRCGVAKLQVVPAGRLEQESETASEAPVWVNATLNCAAWPCFTCTDEGDAAILIFLPVPPPASGVIVSLTGADIWLRNEGLPTAFTKSV